MKLIYVHILALLALAVGLAGIYMNGYHDILTAGDTGNKPELQIPAVIMIIFGAVFLLISFYYYAVAIGGSSRKAAVIQSAQTPPPGPQYLPQAPYPMYR
nr:hypothetical protein [Sicyoidochytrium minutum DNA virus]